MLDTQIQNAMEQAATDPLEGQTIASRWLDLLVQQASIGEAMQSAVYLQGQADTRAKPIGLFCGDISLVRAFNREFDHHSVTDTSIQLSGDMCEEKQRRSLIDFFGWYAYKTNDSPFLQVNEIVDEVARLLTASAIPLPDDASSTADPQSYVEDILETVGSAPVRRAWTSSVPPC